jgi:ApaG protein
MSIATPAHRFTCSAAPQHLPEQSDPERGLYVFAYTITIRNTGSMPAQLIARHWVITDGAGRTEEVKGLGVVGQQPLLAPGETFVYTSGTQLRTAAGVMRGSMFVVAEDGTRFEADVPAFVLDASSHSDGSGQRVLH